MLNVRRQEWQSYESVIRGIFQLLVDQDLVHNVGVQHNVSLQGKTETHQIDIYWKFEIGGIPHEVIVQAKHWNKPVDKGELLKFKSVLDDFPGSAGVFVTKIGYQRGAKAYAVKHGITLYKLDESRPHNVKITTLGWAQYWVSAVPLQGVNRDHNANQQREHALGLSCTVFTPQVSDIKFQHDAAWVKQNTPLTDIDIARIKPAPIEFRDILLYDDTHAVTSNLELVLKPAIEVMKEEKSNEKHLVHFFESPTFLGRPVIDAFYIKVKSVTANIKIESTYHPVRFGNSKFVAYVLEHISSGKTQWFFRTKESG